MLIDHTARPGPVLFRSMCCTTVFVCYRPSDRPIALRSIYIRASSRLTCAVCGLMSRPMSFPRYAHMCFVCVFLFICAYRTKHTGALATNQTHPAYFPTWHNHFPSHNYHSTRNKHTHTSFNLRSTIDQNKTTRRIFSVHRARGIRGD